MSRSITGKIKVLYLASNPFSGSTAVTMRMAMDSTFATVGEISGSDPRVKKLEHRCSCGELTVECEFWRRIEELSGRYGSPTHILDVDKRYRLLNNHILHKLATSPSSSSVITKLQLKLVSGILRNSSRDREIWRKNLALAHAVLDYHQGSVFLDSSKDIERIYRYATSQNVDFFVLHIVRNGLGQLASALKRSGNVEARSASIARFDEGVTRLAQHIDGDRYLRMRYEDFCDSPEDCIDQIKRFCGADRQKSVPRSVKELHVLGNPSRFGFDGVLKAPRSDWHDTLSSSALEAFERKCGARNRAYGYD